ncbi:VCBS repeat-containing protein [Streptosporangiaceae bacterium NEAU-GS5]|nr:VCBS repeat-containing protein [Streptosporangiaceae bacterium NEAU-GS5]
MRRLPFQRLLSRVLGAVAATAVGMAAITVSTISTTAPAHADSVANGSITPTEILSRAQYWVNQGYTYLNDGDRNTWRTGPSGPDRYRRDCSGLISMVWHLAEGYYDTSIFESWIGGQITELGSFNDLQPGDAVLRVNFHGLDDHVELFSHWKNAADHSQGAYFYSFNRTGETVRNPYADSNFGHPGFHSLSDIQSDFEHAIHYNMVMSDVHRPSLNGDGRAEIVKKRTDGVLTAFYNGGLTASKGISWDQLATDGYPIGNGWAGDANSAVYFADLNGDGRADIVKKRTDGVLTAFYNGGLTASKGISWDQLATDGYPIGNGWGGDANSAVYFADLNGDGRADIVKKRTDGVLTAFYNGGLTASKGISWDQLATDGYPIGNGWAGDANSAVYFADLNGDGRADIVKKRTDGVLTAFYNGGLTASKGISWDQLATDGYPIGNGWAGDADSAIYFS